ncbi:MAG: CerR family C-terminal domain-containing protein [Phycisphaeraceae bacterium]|nr:CerR family C-terminal domain-containing protein [Phycisphaeraceae bacterium]
MNTRTTRPMSVGRAKHAPARGSAPATEPGTVSPAPGTRTHRVRLSPVRGSGRWSARAPGSDRDSGTSGGGGGAEATRRRLLDAAEQLFSSRGFEETSVRQLTTAAGCNLAAVNYHFGGKDKLYVEMFRRRLHEMRQRRVDGIRAELTRKRATLESVLRAFISTFLEPLADLDHSRRMCTLYTFELLKRRLPKGMFFEEMILPVQEAMGEAFERFCPKLSKDQRVVCLNSVVGQILHTLEARRMYADAGLPCPLDDTEAMVEHMVKFSAAGIGRIAKKR